MLEIATRIVRDYGEVLGKARPGIYGLPESLLPHSREQIRSSIRYLLKHLPGDDIEIRQSLVHGYVYLAQFIPDQDMKTIIAGQSAALSIDDPASGDAVDQSFPAGNSANTEQEAVAGDAMRLINRIKLAMESAMDEVSRILRERG